MARFIQSFETPVFTSDIGNLDYSTSLMRAHFEISANFAVLCEIDSVASGGNFYVSIFGLGEILQDLLLKINSHYANFTITDTLEDVSVSVTAVRCDFISDISFSGYSRRLFFSSDHLWVPSNGYFFIYCRQNVTPRISVTYADEYDERKYYTINSWSSESDEIFISAKLEINSLLSKIVDAVEIISVRVSVDSSYFDVYVTDAPDVVGFRFANGFGLPDSIYFRSAPIPKIEVDCAEADMGHTSVQYDFETSRHFELSDDSVKPRDWSRIQQFLQSRDIVEMSTGRKVLLSDISVDLGERYDKLGSVKFNYRYFDSRIPLIL